MKGKLIHLVNLLLTIILLFNFTNQAYGQEKFNISAGLGYPELLNVGLHYQFEQIQFGFSVGNDLYHFPRPTVISGNIYYHFAGYSKFSDRHPWYARFGGTYYFRDRPQCALPYIRIGRDFNISYRIGIKFDLGIAYTAPHMLSSAFASSEFGFFFRL